MMWQRADDQHADYTMLMSLVLDEEATEDEAARLREHVAGCESCARTWRRWQELDRRFTLAPVVPLPVDFSVAVAARIDQRVVEHARRRWFMAGLAVSSLVAVLVAVAALSIANGWYVQFLPAGGPLSVAWMGVASIVSWPVHAIIEFVERTGTPTVAAGAGALLCLTCALATAWLWIVARLSPAAEGRLVVAD
jgi:anti-sigma factor RsiW